MDTKAPLRDVAGKVESDWLSRQSRRPFSKFVSIYAMNPIWCSWIGRKASPREQIAHRNPAFQGSTIFQGSTLGNQLANPPGNPTRLLRPYDVSQLSQAVHSRTSGAAGEKAAPWDDGVSGPEFEPRFGSEFEPRFGADAESGDGDEDPVQKRMRLEALLLVAKTPLTTRKLAQLAHLADGTEARTLVRQLNQIYDEHGRSVRIERVAGGFRLLTRSAYAPWLARLGHLPQAMRLSSPMMETLAVVAYRQNVSRADIEAIRGVACGELLRQLMERDLVRIAGRSEELGRPYLYGTTKRFLQLFGLANLEALPSIQWEPIREDSPTDPSEVKHSYSEIVHPVPSTADEVSTSSKESVVSTAVASVIPEIDAEGLPVSVPSPSESAPNANDTVTAVIEDEEDDLYEGDDDFDDDEEDDDDWDDDFADDEEEDDDIDDDEDEDDDDDWEEVDDDDDDLDEDDLGDDDWEEEDDEEDEDWEDEDDEEEDEEEDGEWE